MAHLFSSRTTDEWEPCLDPNNFPRTIEDTLQRCPKLEKSSKHFCRMCSPIHDETNSLRMEEIQSTMSDPERGEKEPASKGNR